MIYRFDLKLLLWFSSWLLNVNSEVLLVWTLPYIYWSNVMKQNGSITNMRAPSNCFSKVGSKSTKHIMHWVRQDHSENKITWIWYLSPNLSSNQSLSLERDGKQRKSCSGERGVYLGNAGCQMLKVEEEHEKVMMLCVPEFSSMVQTIELQ